MRVSHVITARAPIAHGDFGVNSGNVQRFRRIPILSLEGVPTYIPAISAGALRGVVRRLLWREAFDACDLSRGVLPGWDRLYAALANGGTIEAAEKRVVPDAIRARREALPVLSLLGAALYTSHMAGRARVSNSWLECRELGAEHANDPLMRDLLADEARVRHVDQEEQDPDVSGVGPMPTTTETVIAGARFVGHTEIAPAREASAWAHGLGLVQYLGGKAGAGFGEVVIEHDGDGSAYEAWLATHVEPLRDALIQLANELVKGSKKSKKKSKKKAQPKAIEAIADASQGEIF